MPQNTNQPVTGSDGYAPILIEDARWNQFSLNELWLGKTGKGKYVANVGDYVKETDTNTDYIVDHVDPVTLIPTLRLMRPGGIPSVTFEEDDILLGVGPTAPAASMRAYLDRSTVPYTMNIDRRCYVPGSTSSYARVYRGGYVTDGIDNDVISKVYNANGDFVSDRVGLEVALLDSHQVNQHCLKIVDTFRVTEGLLDGEVVTVVAYTQDGHVCWKQTLLVENTAFIAGVSDSQRYITGLSFDSSYLVQGTQDQLEYPLNLPLTSLDLNVIVSYSDGTNMKLPASDPRIEIHGLEQYVSSIPNQRVEIAVFYRMAPEEAALNTVDYVLNKVRRGLTLTTTVANYAHSVQLMGYPIWQNDALGYQMRFWMFNLDRTFFQDVTEYVRWSNRTGPFNPKGYGILQTREVSINLSEVSGSFKTRNHVQVMDIVLMGRPDEGTTPWTMAHISDQSYPSYQGSLKAKLDSIGNTFHIDNGINTLKEWLEQVYYRTRPIYDATSALSAPTPTHVIVRQGTDSTVIPVSAYAGPVTLGRRLDANSTVTMTFIKRTSSGDLYLAQAAMLVQA